MEKSELDKWKKVGVVAAETMTFARKIVKPEMPLVELAEKVEGYVFKKGYKFAFPINLDIENVAAHYTPVKGDGFVAKGLIKIDLGISDENGFLSDTASSVDLTPEGRFKELIKANEEGLKAGINEMKFGEEIGNIGRAIEETIKSKGFVSVKNLSGHSIERWKLHAGVTIPNFDNKNKAKLKEGIYASEPFATTGEPLITEGKPSNIYILHQKKPTRVGREVLAFIEKEYKTLAFSSRWLIDKFGPGALVSLEVLRKQGIIYHFPQLIKKSGEFTSQTEHTMAVLKDKTLVLTERD